LILNEAFNDWICKTERNGVVICDMQRKLIR